MADERLDKRLAGAGFGSRKDVVRLIRSGKVLVDGSTERDAARKVGLGAIIDVDGELVELRAAWHLLCHKPPGVVTSTRDPRDPCIIDLIPQEHFRPDFMPVGRLDKDTTGLLFLTTDGELAHRLTHPRHKVAKRYVAHLAEPATPDDIRVFAAGEIVLDGDPVLPALLDLGDDPRVVGVTLTEGRYHQVKRMFGARGNAVVGLARVRFGPLALDASMEVGAYRRLTAAELRELYTAVGLTDPDG